MSREGAGASSSGNARVAAFAGGMTLPPKNAVGQSNGERGCYGATNQRRSVQASGIGWAFLISAAQANAPGLRGEEACFDVTIEVTGVDCRLMYIAVLPAPSELFHSEYSIRDEWGTVKSGTKVGVASRRGNRLLLAYIALRRYKKSGQRCPLRYTSVCRYRTSPRKPSKSFAPRPPAESSGWMKTVMPKMAMTLSASAAERAGETRKRSSRGGLLTKMR